MKSVGLAQIFSSDEGGTRCREVLCGGGSAEVRAKRCAKMAVPNGPVLPALLFYMEAEDKCKSFL